MTATRSPQRLADVLADVTVLTRADIERQAFGGIADLLRNNGCAEMVRNGGPASTTSLFLRGADTRLGPHRKGRCAHQRREHRQA